MHTTWLLVLYALIVLIGQIGVVAIGVTFWDRNFPSLSMPVSVFLYLAVFVVGWKLALRLTKPRNVQEPAVSGQ
jgi:hypothetical protein